MSKWRKPNCSLLYRVESSFTPVVPFFNVVSTKLRVLFVLFLDFREEKAMTTREVQNRATDQQGSTTEASDQDSDPGSCTTGVKSNRHELASAVESEAMAPPLLKHLLCLPQGPTSSQTGEGRRGGQGEPGRRRWSEPTATPAAFPPELPPQTSTDWWQTRPGKQGGQDRRWPIRRENVRSRGPAGWGWVGRNLPAGTYIIYHRPGEPGRAARLFVTRASKFLNSFLSPQFFCQQEETSNKIWAIKIWLDDITSLHHAFDQITTNCLQNLCRLVSFPLFLCDSYKTFWGNSKCFSKSVLSFYTKWFLRK